MISLAKYQVNFNTVVSNLTAWFYRFTWLIDYLKSIIKPVQDINDDFYATISAIDDYLAYTGQHLSLETCLNDKFDEVTRGIYITENNISGNQIDIYKQGELNPSPEDIYKFTEIDITPFSVYKQSEGAVTLYDFTINVPATLVYDAYEFAGYVTRYVQTKTYNITTY